MASPLLPADAMVPPRTREIPLVSEKFPFQISNGFIIVIVGFNGGRLAVARALLRPSQRAGSLCGANDIARALLNDDEVAEAADATAPRRRWRPRLSGTRGAASGGRGRGDVTGAVDLQPPGCVLGGRRTPPRMAAGGRGWRDYLAPCPRDALRAAIARVRTTAMTTPRGTAGSAHRGSGLRRVAVAETGRGEERANARTVAIQRLQT